jgi:hypothetical protein
MINIWDCKYIVYQTNHICYHSLSKYKDKNINNKIENKIR